MADSVGPGTVLECVAADRMEGWSELVVGRIYTCTKVAHPSSYGGGCCKYCGEGTGILVAEAPLPPPTWFDAWFWCLCRFRPPRSKHVDALITKLSTPERVKEDA